MRNRHPILGCVGVSLLLTGCPLTDHYELMADLAGSGGLETSGSDGGEVSGQGTVSGQAGQSAGGSDVGGAAAGNADAAGSPSLETAGQAGEAEPVGGSTSGGASNAGASNAGASNAGASNAGAGAVNAGGGSSGAGLAGASNGGMSSGGSAGSCSSDLSLDPQNCGACGRACNVGRSCAASLCKGGWVAARKPPPEVVARSRAASVATDKAVFVWGGVDSAGTALDNGAIYTPKTDTWTVLPKDSGSPSARIMATAVWTGVVVVVYGGTDASGSTVYRDGAMYDPLANSWTALPASAAISRRSAPFGYWDGARAIFWGGLNSMNNPIGGTDRYDVANATWSTANPMGDPGALQFPNVASDRPLLYVQGGAINGTRQDRAYSYNGATDKWSMLPRNFLPRSGAFATWDGSHFFVWGGRDDAGALHNDGKYLSGPAWSNVAATAATPSARSVAYRRSGWCFSPKPNLVALLGGQVSSGSGITLSTSGATYDVASSTWNVIPDWPTKELHEYGVGVWTGDEFVLWGGRDANNVPTLTGERWVP